MEQYLCDNQGITLANRMESCRYDLELVGMAVVDPGSCLFLLGNSLYSRPTTDVDCKNEKGVCTEAILAVRRPGGNRPRLAWDDAAPDLLPQGCH